MSNEIITGSKTAVSVVTNHGIGEIIQPLIREIHLFDTWIAGTTHLEDKSVLKELKAEAELLLQREDNQFDSKAILVLNSDKKKLGYVPEKDNVVFSRLMDAGKILKAKVSKIEEKGSWTKVTIGIYLVDL
ncbi:MAG: HIRAN domain-containing protein [Clostridia bacterium]|nr:HIRAN domain-containing protein [Clostridia bacterium]